MAKSSFPIKTGFFLILICFCPSIIPAQEQTKPQNPNSAAEKPKEEILRINTNLIQTGIAVFDKKGQFINDLKQDDFELRVDGKSVPISFFEQIAAKNTVKNSRDITKNEQEKSEKSEKTLPLTNAVRRNRTILFLVDDLHLSFDGLKRTKDLILKFVEREMEPDDLVSVVSTNGKLGFLQQFTSDKTVLRAAVGKLNQTRDNSGITRFSPRMSEYEALLVDRRDDEMTEIFAKILAKENPGTSLEILREQARSQARTVLLQAAVVSRNTYSTLEKSIRNSAQQPGRKIVFLLSEGFLLDVANTDASYQLSLITDAAARSNAVIYSFDANGLLANLPDNSSDINTGIEISGETTSKSSNTPTNRNFTGNSYRVLSGERFESQDGLNLLADSTGGRFIHDTNDLQTALTKALEEASAYYLLAWQPDSDVDKSGKLRQIEVSVKNRPDLKVRLQNGYLDGNSKAANNITPKTAENSKNIIELPKVTKPSASIAEEQLNEAINAQAPKRDLPTAVAVNYLDVPNDGAIMAAVLQIKSEAMEFTPKDDVSTANIDLLGIIYDSKGVRESSFRKLLTLNVSTSQLDDSQDLYYNYQIKLKPGLHQLRIAARDVKSGRVGTAVQWLEIPDLSSKKLALSSLLISEIDENANPRQIISDSKSALDETEVSVERRFQRSSQLRYLIFIYNASRGQTGQMPPDITLQTQILRDNAVITTTPLRQISLEGQELTRLPYAAEFSLDTLTPGRYEIQITVQDRIAKTSASQRLSFEIQ